MGNITAGGTGKTPAVIYLSQFFKKRNYKVAVLSRGYGRKTAGTQLVTNGKEIVDDWRNFGDEPTLISQKLKDGNVISVTKINFKIIRSRNISKAERLP